MRLYPPACLTNCTGTSTASARQVEREGLINEGVQRYDPGDRRLRRKHDRQGDYARRGHGKAGAAKFDDDIVAPGAVQPFARQTEAR